MLLFKPEHVPLILDGTKTQTRRFWKRCRVKVGSVHQARTNMPWQDPSGHFANIVIHDWYQQALAHMSLWEVEAEGYRTKREYFAALAQINRREVTGWEEVWVVDFEVDSVPGGGERCD